MKIPLNFSTFYQIVLKDKTAMSQIAAVNFLLKGVDQFDCNAISDDMTSNYACGAKPLSREIVKEVVDTDFNVIEDRIKKMHIQRARNTVGYIKKLLNMQILDVGEEESDELLRIAEGYIPEYFLTKLFIEAVNSPRTNTKKLDEDTIRMLNAGKTAFDVALDKEDKKKEDLTKAISRLANSPIDQMDESIVSAGKKLLSELDIKSKWRDTERSLLSAEKVVTYCYYFSIPEKFDILHEFVMNFKGLPEEIRTGSLMPNGTVPRDGFHKYYLRNLINECKCSGLYLYVVEKNEIDGFGYIWDVNNIINGLNAKPLFMIVEANYELDEQKDIQWYLDFDSPFNRNQLFVVKNPEIPDQHVRVRAVVLSPIT